MYVEGEYVVAMTLKSDYHIVLGHKMNGSTEMTVDPYLYTSGSDGGGTHTCYCFISLMLDLRKSAWQAVRLAVKSDPYPPLNPYEVLAA